MRVVHVQSPSADTYTSSRLDTSTFGTAISMRLRGLPEKKAMISHLNFKLEYLDASQISACVLKVYIVSKEPDIHLTVYGMGETINESLTSWSNQPIDKQMITSKRVGDNPYVEFDVTVFVKKYLDQGQINFCIQSDSKKAIEISSRESGLGSELILTYCGQRDVVKEKLKNRDKASGYGMKVVPDPVDGKFGIELIGVPAGGFGQLMIMDEAGNIIRTLPMSIRDGELLHHSIDYGDLLPGIYWAVFRKGRVMVRDRFRLQPSSNPHQLLEITALTGN